MSNPRILGGSARGRALETPASGTRPSPARLREALFDILAFEQASSTVSSTASSTVSSTASGDGSEDGPEDGPSRTFLDLYSGSGAIGLEAASRGWRATCVELSRAAAAVIRRNAARLDLDVEVVEGDALDHAASQAGAYTVVFAAPPYPLDLREVFRAVLASGAAAPGGLYVLQHPTGFEVPVPQEGGAGPAVRVKRYGSNSLTLVRVP